MDVIQSVIDVMANAFNFLRTQTPGGFGLLVLPLGTLGGISLLAARHR